MTTNHRPTLENKRGKETKIKDSIQHARLLKSHSHMKLRPDVAGATFPETKTKELEGAGEDAEDAGDAGHGTVGSGHNSDNSDNSVSESESDDESELQAELAKLQQEKQSKLAAPKPSWRRTPFRQKPASVQKPAFTTNTLHSDAHKNFMARYFK